MSRVHLPRQPASRFPTFIYSRIFPRSALLSPLSLMSIMSPDTIAAQQLIQDVTLEEPSGNDWEAILHKRLEKLGKKGAPLRQWHQDLKRRIAKNGGVPTPAMECESAALKATVYSKCRNVDEMFTALSAALEATKKALPLFDSTKGSLQGWLYKYAALGLLDPLEKTRESEREFKAVGAVLRECENRKNDERGCIAGPARNYDEAPPESVHTFSQEPIARAGREPAPPAKSGKLRKWSADDPDTALCNRFGKDDNKNEGSSLYEDRQVTLAVDYANTNERRAKLVAKALEPYRANERKPKNQITDIAADGIKQTADHGAAADEVRRLIQRAVACRLIASIDAEILIKRYLEEATEAQLAQEYGGSQQAMGERIKKTLTRLRHGPV
jgi:hypothetical protein